MVVYRTYTDCEKKILILISTERQRSIVISIVIPLEFFVLFVDKFVPYISFRLIAHVYVNVI